MTDMLPREANLLITWRCNLRCRHCTVYSCGDSYRDMSLEEIGTVLDKLVDSKVLRITVTGGEPLVREDFSEVWREVYRRPFRVSLNTNGTLFTDRNLDIIAEALPRLESLMVSLDGAEEETVDALRGEGTFRMLADSLENLRSRGFRPVFFCTITSLNSSVDQIDSILSYASRYAGKIKLNTILRSGPGISSDLVPEPSALRELAEHIPEFRRRHRIEIDGSLPTIYEMLSGKKQGNWPSFSCGAPFTRMAIFPDGSVTPCDHLPSLVMGNLLNESLHDILQGDVASSFRKTVRRGVRDLPECADCQYRERCTVGCPVYAFSDDCSDIRHPSSCLKILCDE